MYNTHTYDFSGVMKMNMNLNIQQFFEEVDTSGPSINDILNKINAELLASIQDEPVEPIQEPVRFRTSSRLNKYKR